MWNACPSLDTPARPGGCGSLEFVRRSGPVAAGSFRVYSGNRDAGRHLAAHGCTQGNLGLTANPLVSKGFRR
jgi:hypothetical protein